MVAPGREASEPAPELWDKWNVELSHLVERLRSVPVDDRDTWATVARQTAGALASWSNAIEETPGDLAAAAEALSRSAQTYRRTVKPHKAGTLAISGAAMLLASAARGGQGPVGQAAMIRQLLRLTQAVYDSSVAAGQARQAQLLAQDTRARLVRVRDAMPSPAIATVSSGITSTTMTRPTALDPEAQAMLDRLRAGQARPTTEVASPLPNKIEPALRRQHSTPGADRGPER